MSLRIFSVNNFFRLPKIYTLNKANKNQFKWLLKRIVKQFSFFLYFDFLRRTRPIFDKWIFKHECLFEIHLNKFYIELLESMCFKAKIIWTNLIFSSNHLMIKSTLKLLKIVFFRVYLDNQQKSQKLWNKRPFLTIIYSSKLVSITR